MDDSETVPTISRVFNVVGFAGSLRRGSYNRALLRAATELAPSTLHILKFDADGRLVHQGTRDFLATFLQRFADFIARFTSVSPPDV